MFEGLFEGAKSTIENQLLNNDFFAGGFLLGLVTTVVMSLRTVPSKLWVLFTNRFTTRVYVDSTQDTYYWVHIWMSHQNFGKKANRISIRVNDTSTNNIRYGSMGPRYGNNSEDATTPEIVRARIIFSLGEGKHFVRYSGKWLLLELFREKQNSGNGQNQLAIYESIMLRYMGTKRGILEEIISEAVDLITPDSGNYIDLYTWNGYEGWNRLKRRSGRNPETLAYGDGIFDGIVEEISQFRTSAQWYKSVGIPYKKTFLLHGPPGTGKTSMAVAMATLFKCSLYTIDLSSGIADVKSLLFALHNVKSDSLILIEDIHTVGST